MPFAVHEQQSLNVYIEQVTGDMQQRRFALPARLSADAADLLGQLLHPDPAARINIAGALTLSRLSTCPVASCVLGAHLQKTWPLRMHCIID
jgi:hypothetical protein